MIAARSVAASAKRRQAPQRGSSSRLLKRIATAFPPARIDIAKNAASAVRSSLPFTRQHYEQARGLRGGPKPARQTALDRGGRLLRLAGAAVAQPLDQIRDVRELLLEVALVLLQPLEDTLTVVPTAPDAVVASKAAVSMSSVRAWSPPLSVSREESVQPRLRISQRASPLVEERAPLVRQLVDPLARAGRLVVPLGADDPVGLEQAEEAVEVAHVDALAGQLGELLEQLVAVHRALAEEQQNGRLGEALDPRPNLEVARPDPPPHPRMTMSPHTCKTHM